MLDVVCTEAAAQSGHAPAEEFSRDGLIPYPEAPSRYAAIRAALEAAPWAAFREPVPQADALLRRAHDDDYLDFLRRVWPAWQAGGGTADLVASTFASTDGRRPADPAAALGYYGIDTTPFTAGTWAATRAAADAALTAVDGVRGGAAAAYALCRPPGHHAGRRRFGGFCYLNHAALAACRLAEDGPVAVVDVDYHHGNGTQEIFYARPDVLFVSLHADPEFEYPLFWGRADETGTGAGQGATLNLPLPAGTGDDAYLQQLHGALGRVRDFSPRHLVVSLGFDTWQGDPLGSFRLTVDGIGRVGAALAGLALPTVILQEGGYDVAVLGELACRFLEPFA